MTETTTKSAARLLAEAAGIARFSAADGWPVNFGPEQLAALMAGCRRTDDRKRYDAETRLIANGIRDKLLAVIEKSKTILPKPRKIGFVASWKNQHYGRDPNMFFQPEPVTTRWLVIDRAAAVAWLDAIGEPPGEYVRAWLGDACPEPAKAEAPKRVKATSKTTTNGKRDDAMSIELDSIIADMEGTGERISATAVMARLKRRIGKDDSCVVDKAADGDGVIWERANGSPETMNFEALEKRLARRRSTR